MSKRVFPPGAMLNPVPVVMVSCGDMDKEKNIITIGWTGIVNTHPAMTYISVRNHRHSYAMIKESGNFVINLVNTSLTKAADWCGVRSGSKYDKFKEMNLHPVAATESNTPMIEESPVNIECRIEKEIPLGSHTMFLARIIAVNVEDALIDEEGKICFDKANLVAYSHGEYFPLAKSSIGSFGYSVMKKRTKKKRQAKAMKKRQHRK